MASSSPDGSRRRPISLAPLDRPCTGRFVDSTARSAATVQHGSIMAERGKGEGETAAKVENNNKIGEQEEDESGEEEEIQLHPSKSVRRHLFYLLLAIILLGQVPPRCCLRLQAALTANLRPGNSRPPPSGQSGWPALVLGSSAGDETDVIRIKVGALFESSDHEQANMFIRTIKMINERRDETIRRLLNVSDSSLLMRSREPETANRTAHAAGEHSGPQDASSSTTTTSSSTLFSSTDDHLAANDGYDEDAHNQSTGQAEHAQRAARSTWSWWPGEQLSLVSEQQQRQQQHPIRVKMEPMIEFLEDRHNSLQADEKVCQLIESGVRVIVGPSDGASIQHVQSICDNIELPYFELRPFLGSPPAAASSDSRSSVDEGQQDNKVAKDSLRNLDSNSKMAANKLEDLTLNLYPPAHLLNSAYIDLIYAWNWTSFVIVYQDGSSMIKLQDLFKESSGSWTSRWQIRLFQFDPDSAINKSSNKFESSAFNQSNLESVVGSTGDTVIPELKQIPTSEANPKSLKDREKLTSFRDIFWRIRMSGEQNILLDVKTEHLYAALKQAQQVGCMTERFNYLITSLDLHTIDLEDFKYSRTRLTALSILQLTKTATGGQTGEDLFDETYLEKLGIHTAAGKPSLEQTAGGQHNHRWSSEAVTNKPSPLQHKLSPSVVLDRTGAFMEPPADVYKDWSRREQLMSSPASMGLLPSVDRDNEQRLFEFFISQQEQQRPNRVRLSTSSAVLHDSLLLLTLGLQELDPSGSLLQGELTRGESPLVGCSGSGSPWPHGSSLVNYMRRMAFNGLTGPISFDQRGLRADFKLDVLGMAPNVGLVKVGEWRTLGSQRSVVPREAEKAQVEPAAEATPLESEANSYEELSKRYLFQLHSYQNQLLEGRHVQVPYEKVLNRPPSRTASLKVNDIIFSRLYHDQTDQVDTLIVTTKLSQPYFMLKETPNKLEGNDQYEGFAVDLIHELSKLVNFRYRWREVADKKYGSKEVLPNGTVVWNGMIGEIVRGQADLAIVDLTITAQREEAVDFTLPFMNTGISILFKKPTTKVTTLFSFLSPFSSDVWAYVLAAYCGISAILFFVGHLSPYEWADPHPCRHSTASGQNSYEVDNDDCDDDLQASRSNNDQANFVPSNSLRLNRSKQQVTLLKNQFSLLNSFWFTIGSLMQQGSDLTPRSMSTRTIAGIWYFFTLIMISSYTANLAAFLTVEKVVYPIENVRDLSAQQEIKYGCVESGSTCTFFHDSQIDTYKLINENMRRYRTYVRSNDEGQKRVEEGKFAFFMESASIEYIVERNCNLTQIGGLLDSKGYGLATSKKSRLRRPYRTLLSEGILHLQETGMLHILKNRWWKERRGGGTCTDDGKGGGVTELSLANVGGVFVVLLGGLGISFLVAIAEFMWRSRRRGNTRDRMCEEMMADLRFALACKRSTKPTGAALERQLREAQKQRRREEARQRMQLMHQQQLHQQQLIQQHLLAGQNRHLANQHQLDDESTGNMQALVGQLDTSMLAPTLLTALLTNSQKLAVQEKQDVIKNNQLVTHLAQQQIPSSQSMDLETLVYRNQLSQNRNYRPSRRRLLLAQETLDDESTMDVDPTNDIVGWKQ